MPMENHSKPRWTNPQFITTISLITANDKPIALAGLMGGEKPKFMTIQNLILEAALFDSVVQFAVLPAAWVYVTEASARFERGVNYAELEIACRRLPP